MGVLPVAAADRIEREARRRPLRPGRAPNRCDRSPSTRWCRLMRALVERCGDARGLRALGRDDAGRARHGPHAAGARRARADPPRPPPLDDRRRGARAKAPLAAHGRPDARPARGADLLRAQGRLLGGRAPSLRAAARGSRRCGRHCAARRRRRHARLARGRRRTCTRRLLPAARSRRSRRALARRP